MNRGRKIGGGELSGYALPSISKNGYEGFEFKAEAKPRWDLEKEGHLPARMQRKTSTGR